jgi:two-component system, OmpR family, alkaline phosphatase synthesis response regulator PhoP
MSTVEITKRILLVEDEPGLIRTLTDRLSKEGYEAESAADGPSGLQMARGGSSFDLIILDVMLPGSSGLDVCRDIRQHGVKTPILMLTAKSQTVDKVVGLKLGADDYLTKPFEMMELLARIEALLRRASSGSAAGLRSFEFGAIRVELRNAKVFRDGQPVVLTAREFKLLQYFIEHRGAILSRDELLNAVWGYDAMPFTRTVDVHVACLRHKLEPNPRHPQFILTIHGFGYRFADR